MKFDATQFKKDVIYYRRIVLDITFDEVKKQIGVSKSTLSRIENGSTPDLDTFGKICGWLKLEPNKYFKKQPPTPKRGRLSRNKSVPTILHHGKN